MAVLQTAVLFSFDQTAPTGHADLGSSSLTHQASCNSKPAEIFGITL